MNNDNTPDTSAPGSDEESAKTEVEKTDIALGKKLAGQRDEPLVKAAGVASKIGDQGPLYAICGAIVLCGLAVRDRRLTDTGVTLLAGVAAADAGKSLTKHMVKRTRPQVLLDQHRYKAEVGGSDEKQEQSFPSGHMAGTVAFARALSRGYPKAGAFCGVASLALGWSRVAKGAHWPLDIAAGAVVGLIGEEVTSRILRALGLPRRDKRRHCRR